MADDGGGGASHLSSRDPMTSRAHSPVSLATSVISNGRQQQSRNEDEIEEKRTRTDGQLYDGAKQTDDDDDDRLR